MKLHPIVSTKTGRKGYWIRHSDPDTGKRIVKTFWYADKRQAEKAVALYFDGVSARRDGLPDNSGWKMPYTELVEKFVDGFPFRTERRRLALQRILLKNPLGINTGADLAHKGHLSARCQKLLKNKPDVFVIKWVQEPLKQLTAWAASVDLFPYDPLGAWKKLPRSSAPERRGFFMPDEMRAILAANDELDERFNRRYPLSIVFKALLITGNRPGALFRTTVGDFDGEHIQMPPPVGSKANGCATVSAEFAGELYRYIVARGRPEKTENLFVSAQGDTLDVMNIQKDWRLAATLGFVHMNWPKVAPQGVKPVDVALAIHRARIPGFDGAPPTNPDKLRNREIKRAGIAALVAKLKPIVLEKLACRPMYSLRHTHLTWARLCGVSVDARNAQVGHKGRSIEDRHYFGAEVDASPSSQAVWEVLTGVRELSIVRKQRELRRNTEVTKSQIALAGVVAGDEKTGTLAGQSNASEELELVGATSDNKSGLDGTRTRDLRRDKPTL